MTISRASLFAMTAGLILAGSPAHARECALDRQTSLSPGVTYALTFKVKVNAVCEYGYFTSKVAFEGITITERPPEFVAKTNPYGMAFTFRKVGQYRLGYTVQTSKGPIFVKVAVDVVPESF